VTHELDAFETRRDGRGVVLRAVVDDDDLELVGQLAEPR